MTLPGLPYLLLIAFLAGSAGTWKVMDWKYDAELARGIKVAMVLKDDDFRTVIKVETVVQEKIRTIVKEGKTIVVEVPTYVTAETDAAMPLAHGFVRVLDAAATGKPAGPAAVTDANPAAVAPSRAAVVVADNYTEYRTCREQVIGWNEFYADLQRRHAK